LRALENGGNVQGGESALVKLSAVSTAEGGQNLNKTKLLWEPYLERSPKTQITQGANAMPQKQST
jgi:hypothetical protein